jgi:PAS domain S-box-containing protein
MLTSNADNSADTGNTDPSALKHPLPQNLLDAVPCPVFYRNVDGVLLGCNRAFKEMIIGSPDQHINGMSLADLQGRIPSDIADLAIEEDAALFESAGRQHAEVEVRCGDGKTRAFAFHTSAMADEDGKIIGIAGLLLDITAARTAETELKRYRNKLEEMASKRSAELMATNNRLSIEIEDRRKAEKALQKSEERYRSMFENMGTPTILIEEDMTISMANAKAEKLTGLSKEELQGQFKTLDFVAPQDRERIELYHELRMQGDVNVPRQYDLQISLPDGKIRDLLANVQWIPETRQTIATLMDITERNLLQKERQQLAAVIDQSMEAVVITDKHGRVEYVNQAFEQLSGFDRTACIGQAMDAPFFSHQDQEILKQMTFMVSGDDSWQGRVENQRLDGEIYISDTRIFPICDERGNAINLVCVKNDVTHEVQLEKQLQHSQKMEAIGTLAGGIAHDFNNILGGILGYAEISMNKAGGNKELKRNLDRILDGCRRAKELVHNILTFSRSSDEEAKPIEMQIIVKEALKLLRASIPSTIEFREQISSEPSIVHATPTQIHQVIMNLCTNAAHAMIDNGGVLMIGLENIEGAAAVCESLPDTGQGACCRLRVRDTGEGMAPEIRQRIFEPYFTTKDQTGGTGLGLSMVHGIIQNCGGRIAVDSEPGKGTIFDIYLPCVVDVSTREEPTDVSLPEGRERILVVDDEPFILEILDDMLHSLGYDVVTAECGREAFELFSQTPDRFDAVIADLTMPRVTGTQLADKIKQLGSDIPLILTTGMTLNQNAYADQFGEFTAVLNKPILLKELAETVRQALDRPEKE